MKRFPAALLGLLAVAPSAWAQTCSGSISNIDFGTPNLLSGGVVDAQGTLTVSCTGIGLLSSVKVCPGIGAGSGGSNAGGRLMTGSTGDALSYQLFQDAGHTLPWGDTNSASQTAVPFMTLSGGLVGSATATRTVYARLFAGQNTVRPGAYLSDFGAAFTNVQYAPYLLVTGDSCMGFVGSASFKPTFTVRASPAASCTIGTQNLAFGSWGVLRNPINATGTVTASCTRSTSYSVSLDGGNAAAAPTARRMSLGGEGITYGLYRDAAHSQPWGDAAAGLAVSGVGTGASQPLTVYGRVPAQTTPRPGAYSDRITATITY